MSAVTVESLELSQIVPSSTNPRKSFDPVALEQLAESIKEIGITVPILVRPRPWRDDPDDATAEGAYELVSGHRRLKAAAIAGLETIPAFIRELTDAEALDIQMVENLQRADLHPMDEAAGYQALVTAAAERGEDLTQVELAHKVGKPLSYVAQRVKLLDLAETPRKVFQEGHINIGHALLLARLTPELQDEGLCAIFDPMKQYRKSGKKTATPAEVVDASIKAAKNFYSGPREAARPATEFKGWIKANIELDLKQAPWDLGDEHMHPEAGSCVKCPKRSGNNPALFAELTTGEDKCTDPACFDLKAKTFVQIKLKAQTSTGKPMLNLSQSWGNAPLDGSEKKIKRGQWVEAKKGECPDARQGVMSEGAETGKVLWVCINQKCKKHKHNVDRPEEKRETTASGHTVPKGMTKAEYEAQQKLEQDREQAECMAIYQALRAKAMKAKRDTLLVEYVVLSLDQEVCTDIEVVATLNGWVTPTKRPNFLELAKLIEEKMRSLTGAAFNALIFDLAYGDLSDRECYRDDVDKIVGDLMKTYEVDEKAVLAKVKAEHPELYPEAKDGKPAKGKKAAKKSAAPKPEPVDRKSAAAGEDDDDLPDFGDPKDEADDYTLLEDGMDDLLDEDED